MPDRPKIKVEAAEEMTTKAKKKTKKIKRGTSDMVMEMTMGESSPAKSPKRPRPQQKEEKEQKEHRMSCEVCQKTVSKLYNQKDLGVKTCWSCWFTPMDVFKGMKRGEKETRERRPTKPKW